MLKYMITRIGKNMEMQVKSPDSVSASSFLLRHVAVQFKFVLVL